MGELSIIPNGALLIRNRTIEEVGPSRRLENLAAARGATVLDASRRVVMPAFTDADFPLVLPAMGGDHGARDGDGHYDEGAALRKTAREIIRVRAIAAAGECARYGCLTIGAHTAYATDLRNIRRVLRTHQMLNWKPLRIRSIFSIRTPRGRAGRPANTGNSGHAMAARGSPGKTGGRGEFNLRGEEQADNLVLIREAATAAAAMGFAIRLRSARRPAAAILELAVNAGAIAIVAPTDSHQAFVEPLAALGCIRVLPASESFDHERDEGPPVRAAIGGGGAGHGFQLPPARLFLVQYAISFASGRAPVRVDSGGGDHGDY